jgi:formylglycine-generating enzyme required for sulfatase activity
MMQILFIFTLTFCEVFYPDHIYTKTIHAMRSLIFFLCLITAPVVSANGISVTNVSISDQSAFYHFCKVKFDITWDNSWRTTAVPDNWDAAWIFIKYRAGDGIWHHASLLSTGHTVPAGSEITPSSDGKGVFMYRSSNGNGTNNWNNTELLWNYGANGVPDDASIEINVIAIEMVYVPQGNFYIGDGNGTNESLSSFHTGTNNSSVLISSSLTGNIRTDVNDDDDNQIETNGIGIDGDSGIDTDDDGDIDNAVYPTGYTAFYMMKYEISQEQYSDFLNMLTRTQQNSRVNTDITGTNITNYFVMSNTSVPSERNGIRCDATIPASPAPVTFYCDLDNDGDPDQGCSGKNLACNYFTYMDEAAYADWAGLRMMTELEFEKACRGPNNSNDGEFAWGSTSINSSVYTIQNSGCPAESIVSLPQNTGNASYDLPASSLYRCGIFAAGSVNHTRQESGAGYYGVMELSGNLYERIVHIGSIAGRSYTGLHGDGELTSSGSANVSYWPGINGNTNPAAPNTVFGGTVGCTASAGSGRKGGAWTTGSDYLRISDRAFAGYIFSYGTYMAWHGGRFVRTAP